MFGLVRLVILCAVAFVAGVLYERHNTGETCDTLGGRSANGLCLVKDTPS